MYSKIDTHSLRPNELEAVYAISRIVAETMEIDEALDRIFKLVRKVLIFDNTVIYFTHPTNELDPVFARAIGRGRSSPSDVSWGDIAAREVIKTGDKFIYQSKPLPEADRLDQHFFLGLPMLVGGKLVGALVFIRFGGPQFNDEQINLADFISVHVSQIYERQRLVERIANLEAERRLARLQDDFIAMVSHELNTPLGFIKGYTTTLLRQDTDWDQQTQQEFLTIIDEEADKLTELIENLLDSSRLQAGILSIDLKTTQLDDLLKQELGQLQTRYQTLRIQLDIIGKQFGVRVDCKRLVQVIDNLLSNAAKYAPNSTVRISLEKAENQVMIKVSDSGPGISPEHLQHVFERFYRIPDSSAGVRGTGLGLFICQRLIHAHHGEITVESELNNGTTFIIRLPTSDQIVKKEEEYG